MTNYKSEGTGIFHLPNGVNNKVLIPRTFVMRPGLTLLMGSLGRLDVLKVSSCILLSFLSMIFDIQYHLINTQFTKHY